MVDKIKQEYKIFDFGRDGRTGQSPNYNLELRLIKGFNQNNSHYKVMYGNKIFTIYKFK